MNQEQQKNFEKFTQELAKLSHKYDIAIQSVGGVYIGSKGELANIAYSDDSTSGDLSWQ